MTAGAGVDGFAGAEVARLAKYSSMIVKVPSAPAKTPATNQT